MRRSTPKNAFHPPGPTMIKILPLWLVATCVAIGAPVDADGAKARREPEISSRAMARETERDEAKAAELQAQRDAAQLIEQNDAILLNQQEIIRRLEEARPKEKTPLEKILAESEERAARAAAIGATFDADSEAKEEEERKVRALRESETASLEPVPRIDERVVFAQRPYTAADSEQTAKERYLFLINRADPRRKLYDAFLAAGPKTPRYEAMSQSTYWPEFAADECARLYGWRTTKGNFKAAVASKDAKALMPPTP